MSSLHTSSKKSNNKDFKKITPFTLNNASTSMDSFEEVKIRPAREPDFGNFELPVPHYDRFHGAQTHEYPPLPSIPPLPKVLPSQREKQKRSVWYWIAWALGALAFCVLDGSLALLDVKLAGIFDFSKAKFTATEETSTFFAAGFVGGLFLVWPVIGVLYSIRKEHLGRRVAWTLFWICFHHIAATSLGLVIFVASNDFKSGTVDVPSAAEAACIVSGGMALFVVFVILMERVGCLVIC